MAKKLQATMERQKISGITDLGQDTKATRFNPNTKTGKKNPMERVKIAGITDLNQDTKASRFSAGNKA